MMREIVGAAALLLGACTVDRELAFEGDQEWLSVHSQDLHAVCQQLEHAMIEMACGAGSPESTTSWIYGTVCAEVLRDPSTKRDCFAARASDECMAAATELIACIVESKTCYPEEDCADVWVPECAPSYGAESREPVSFVTECAAEGIGYYGYLSAQTFTGVFEACEDGHEYSFRCPVGLDCGLPSCTCMVDGVSIGTVSVDVPAWHPDVEARVQLACGFAYPSAGEESPPGVQFSR